jgi:hypothetical protein
MWGVSMRQKAATLARISRKSPSYLRNIPVFGRLCVETFFDLHSAVDVAVLFGLRQPEIHLT